MVGIEGNNPSGHCLIASKIIDSIPLSVPADVSLHSAKRQALDKENQLTDPSSTDEELSVVCKVKKYFSVNLNCLGKQVKLECEGMLFM